MRDGAEPLDAAMDLALEEAFLLGPGLDRLDEVLDREDAAAIDPSGRRPLGIRRAPGRNRLRRRFQSRGPAGPEMVS